MRTEPPMSPAYWQQYLDGRLNLISQTLGTKAAEYASGGDRMHNFNRTYIAAAGRHRHREDGMLGMMLKHWVSILDMVDALADGTLPKEAVVKEKFGDMINYCMLMEASILHKLDLAGSLFETTEVLKEKSLPKYLYGGVGAESLAKTLQQQQEPCKGYNSLDQHPIE